MNTHFSKNRKLLFLILTFFSGVLILSPYLNFQTLLSQGDHGRDLYSFRETYEGAVPYRDYWSQNGPLMPYYYSGFFHIGGVKIQSVLLGYNILILLAGVFVYLACSTFLTPVMSFACAMWYWAFRGDEFFYTYNHIGAVLLMLMILHQAMTYVKQANLRSVFLGAFFLFLLLLVRPNIGAATLCAFFLSLIIVDFRKKNPRRSRQILLYAALSLSIAVVVFFIYWALLHNLPSYEIHKDLGYAHAIHKALDLEKFLSGFTTLKHLFVFNFLTKWPQKIFCFIFLLLLIRFFFVFKRRELKKEERIDISLGLSTLFLFLFFNFHEFWASGEWPRAIWIMPIFFIVLHSIIDISTRRLSPFIRLLFVTTLIAALSYEVIQKHLTVTSMRKPSNLFSVGENRVYLSPTQQEWIKTVSRTTDFLKEFVPTDEYFLAVPYCPLYYFLTGQDSPIRQLTFLGRSNPAEQRAIIETIETKNVDYIVLSNRALRATEPRVGTFGETYAHLFSEYIFKNYQGIVTFGPWEDSPGWVTKHAVIILKKIE